MLHFLKNILQLVINPTRGWEDISGDASTPQDLCRVGLYPMLAISALSCVGGLWKLDSDTTLIAIIQNAIITFTSFFATKFFAEFIMGLTMDKICDKLSHNDSIWYATNIEIYNYMTAQKQLQISVDERTFYNPTAIDVWVERNKEEIIHIPAGQTVTV